MGYYGECVVADISFESQRVPIARINRYIFDKPNYFTWQFADNWTSTKYRELCYGMMVQQIYTEKKNPPPQYDVSINQIAPDTYEFSFKMGNNYSEETIFHVILPECCILTDECAVRIGQNPDYTPMLREKRECITLALDNFKRQDLKLTFLKVGDDIYRKKREEVS